MTTIVSIFTIISALAAVMYTIITFKTLKEIKAQRETTYRPDIIVDEGLFYIYSYKTKDWEFPVEYTYDRKDPHYNSSSPGMNLFNVNLFNIGLAAAKEVRIEYSIQLDGIIKKILEQNKLLPADKTIDIEKSERFIEFKPSKDSFTGGSFHSIENQLRKDINHILPVNVSSNPIQISLPSYILEIHSILIYNFWMDRATQKEFPNLPIVTIHISYLDIGNNKHSKTYELSISYHGGTKNESINSFTVKQIKSA